jgi:hypothetical protein
MAIPSGSGTEVVRSASLNAVNNAVSQIDWAGAVRASGNTAGTVAVPANTIVTILNIVCHISSSAQNLSAHIDWLGGGTDILLFYRNYTNIQINDTFVFNEKIVLYPGSILEVWNSGSSCDWMVNFIYQDWS